MSHEITLRANGSAEMAFVGETPWHGLGQSVTKGASIGVWAKEAGMDWEAKEAPVQYQTEVGGSILHQDPSSKVIYRSDTGAALSVMGSGYEIVQPMDVLEFFRDMTEVEGWHIHTAGSLRGGRKLWAMATRDEGPTAIMDRVNNLKQQDHIHNNLLLATSLDGSMTTQAMLTAVRVVCANTLALALDADGANKVRVSHKSIFDPRATKRALGVSSQSFAIFIHRAREMAETPVKLDEATELLRMIFKIDMDEKAKQAQRLSWLGDLSSLNTELEVKDSRLVTRTLELWQGEGMGADLKSSKGTRWGLLNAVTQLVDHELGRSDDTRLDAAWFGRGATFKQDAFELLSA